MLINLKGKLKDRLSRGDLSYFLLLSVVVLLPVYYSFLPPFMILLFLSWILENIVKQTFNLGPVKIYRTLFFLFISYFAWLIISVFYSTNTTFAWSSIFGRLSLVLFPLVMIFPGERTRTNITKILRIFVFSTVLHLLTCYSYAFYQSVSIKDGIFAFNSHPNPWVNYFFYLDFSYLLHPTYLAMFVVFSIFVALESVSDKTLLLKTKVSWVLISIFLIISVYFITSRSGILATILLLFLYFCYKIKRSKSRKLIWLVFLLIFVVSLPLFKYNEKVSSTVYKILHNSEQININQDERIIVWASALNIIKSNFPMGVGVGDVGTELVKEYERVGAKRMAELRYNAHNQFLEVWLESGIIGFMQFVGIFILMAFIAIKDRNLLFGIFLISMIIFFSFETILYRFAGVSFFSLFSFLLLYVNKSPEISQLKS